MALGAVLIALTGAACDSKHGMNLVPDQPPTLTLTSGPIDTLSAPQSWLVDIAWVASDPDGRIDHFEYAIDPPTAKQARLALAETAWVSTHETHVVARFRASHADSLGPGATASDFHVFVLRAFDDRGGVSPTLVRAFYATTVAPDVRFVDPLPNRLLPAKVSLPFQLAWSGSDPDGGADHRPAAYRLRFLSLDNGQNLPFMFDPDSLLRLGAKTNWEGWNTIDGENTAIIVEQDQLGPGTSWMAALLAVDEAGASTAYLTQDLNQLVFEVSPSLGPTVHVFDGDFGYISQHSGLSYTPPHEVPAGKLLRFSWEGLASAGRHITGTRWMLDGNINDETPRRDEATDLAHWSALTGINPTSATFTLIQPGEHLFYIEAFDNFGASSILGVKLSAVAFFRDRELLVVDDTRLEPDKFAPSGCPNLYTQPWPSAAELDTFLYARGGVPWRCARNPSDALSPPGLLAGYAFDTLGTRTGFEEPGHILSLSRLSSYKHVLWIVDEKSALQSTAGSITTLRAMCSPTTANVLAQYVQGGGQVWLAGGGAGLASLIEFNNPRNDGRGVLFTFDADELRPGRMIYDQAHVRSALGVELTGAEPQRSAAARGGWSGHGPDGTLSAPDYAHLPASLHFKTEAADPIPPTRSPSQGGLFYHTNAANEYVAAPDTIAEDMGTSPEVRIEPTLDTLYDVTTPLLTTPNAPVMLYYHGRENPPFVYTGFDLWSWTRADCQSLVDFVLGDIWGMPKAGPSTTARPAGASPLRAPRPVTPRVSAGLDPHPTRP